MVKYYFYIDGSCYKIFTLIHYKIQHVKIPNHIHVSLDKDRQKFSGEQET